VPVSKIPNFNPVQLPFWNVYEAEGTASTIKAGGTMAGEFTAGLSGGQRKLLLFELVVQRVRAQSNLLICLDEPFAGVTDDFVPFILERLVELKNKHQILLVTNDHVEALTKMADNTHRVSAIDRTTVRINAREKVNREKAILALAVGDNYIYTSSWEDLKFFFDVEVASSGSLMGVAVFTVFVFALFLATFWDSKSDSAALVLVGGNIIAYLRSAVPSFPVGLAKLHGRRSRSTVACFQVHEQGSEIYSDDCACFDCLWLAICCHKRCY